MKQKSSFLIYHEYREPLKLLTDEQRGQLLMALIDYSESGVVPELDGTVSYTHLTLPTTSRV